MLSLLNDILTIFLLILDGNLDNDIALVKLKSPVTANAKKNIVPICVPTSESTVPNGAVCFASGWGIDGNGSK